MSMRESGPSQLAISEGWPAGERGFSKLPVGRLHGPFDPVPRMFRNAGDSARTYPSFTLSIADLRIRSCESRAKRCCIARENG
jgi:hypothetical protein